MRSRIQSDPIIESLPTEVEQRQLIDEVANSHLFQNSPTLKAFFAYVAEHTLAGRLDEVKEQRIGWHVLGRKPDYDTANDNIVRIRARQVRQKLDEYFETAGRDSRWIISIPKGGYAPVFQKRPLSLPTQAESVTDIPASTETMKSYQESEGHRPTSPPARFHFNHWLPWVIAAGATLALCLLIWRDVGSRVEATTADSRDLWGQFFPVKGREVTLVVADSGFAVWQDVAHRKQSLADYVDRSFLREPEGSEAARHITNTPYTSLADVILTLRISQIATRFGGRVNIKHARNVNIHDFGLSDLVLLGSPQSNPWVELFEPGMSFILARDQKSGEDYFLNKSPKPGEPESFHSTPFVGGRASEESYAVAALRPNLAGTGHVLILEGIDMEGTEAAGEFVCNPSNLSTLVRAAGATRETTLKPFEALIKLRAIPGGYEALEMAAFRYGAPSLPRS
jgi:hypothetical protein